MNRFLTSFCSPHGRLRLQTMLVGGLGGLLALTTLLFGGAGPLLAALLLPVLFMFAVLGLLLAPRPACSIWGMLLLGVAALLVLWTVLGLLPAGWLGLAPHPFWQTLMELDLQPAFVAAGAAPADGWLSALAGFALLGIAGWLVLACSDDGIAVVALKGVALSALIFALYGLVVYAQGNDSVLWLAKTDYVTSLSASFISRNHAATMLGLGLIAAIGLVFRRIGEISGRLDTRQRLRAFNWLVLRPGLPWILAALVMFCALVLTASRAGVLSALLGFSVLLGALFVARPPARVGLGIIIVLAVALGGVSLVVLGGKLDERAGQLLENTSLIRLKVNELSAATSATMPLTGHGLTAWDMASAPLRGPEGIPVGMRRLENPHSLPWQLITELGWPGFALAAMLLALAFGVMARGLMVRRRQVVYPAVGLGALTVLTAHSMVDFPLYIPAVALAGVMLVAVGLGQSERHDTEARPMAPWLRGVVVVVAGLAALGSVWLARAEWQRGLAAPVMEQLRMGKLLPAAQLGVARDHLLTCRALNPWHRGCAADLSLLFLNRAGQMGTATVPGQLWLRAAELYGRQALALAPGDAVTAYRVARAVGLQRGPQAAVPWLLHSMTMGPLEPRLAVVRAVLLLEVYPALQGTDALLVERHIQRLWELTAHDLWRQVRAAPGLDRTLATVLVAGRSGPEVAESLPARWRQVTRRAWPLGNAPASP